MSCIRSRMRSRLTRASTRASGPPGHECAPRPNAMCSRAFGRSSRNSAGHSKCLGSRFAAPFSSMTGVPAAMSTSPTRVGRRARRKSALTGLSMRSASSTKSGMRPASARSSSWSGGDSARYFKLVASSRAVGLLPRREQEGRGADDRRHFRRRPVGVLRQRQLGEDVVAGRTPPVLDVAREPVVEPPERVHLHLALLGDTELAGGAEQAEPLAEPLMIGLRHPEEVGDDEHGERLRVRVDELAAAAAREFVELPIGQAPHERLVLLEPHRRQQPHQQGALARVIGRVHRHHVLAHRELVPIAVDDVAHVVTLERDGELREGTDHRVARRERREVAIDLGRLLPPGDRHHAVMGRRHHRALRAQVVEVRVRVLQQGLVGEEVDLLEPSHSPLLSAQPTDRPSGHGPRCELVPQV